MEFLKWPKIPRLNRDMIITEKIDGTNAQVYITPVKDQSTMREDFEKRGWRVFETKFFMYPLIGVVPGSRNRFLTLKKDNFGFAKWVNENAEELLHLGPGRHYGEWWGQGIQRTYGLKEKRLSLFNTSRYAEDLPLCCSLVPTLYMGMFDQDIINKQLNLLRTDGSVAAPGFMKPEGIVVFHTASNQTFKVTLENDEVPKGRV